MRALYARFRQLIHEAGRFGVVGLAGLAVTDGGANLLKYRAGLAPWAATAIAIVVATAVTSSAAVTGRSGTGSAVGPAARQCCSSR